MSVAAKKTGLGRGLEALIPRVNTKLVSTSQEVTKDKVHHLDVSSIHPNPNQPRKTFEEKELQELADSIRIHGIISPLVVTPVEKGYELIAGERRWRAAQLIGLQKVPCLLRSAKEMERLELAIVENVQRQNLNPIEKALAYDYLITQCNVTTTELAKRLGIAHHAISLTRSFLKLPENIQEALRERKIKEDQALPILQGDTPEQQQQIFEFMVKNRPRFELARNFISKLKNERAWRPKDKGELDPNMVDQSNRLEKYLGVPVRFQATKVKKSKTDQMHGMILIDFSSRDEYFMVMHKLLQEKSDEFVV